MSSQQIGLAVATIVQNSKSEVLLIKRKKEPKVGYLSLPGGHVEFGETVMEAAKRELKEETNIEAEPKDFVSFYESIHSDYHKFILIFKINILDGSDAIAGDDASEVVWMNLENLKSVEKVTNMTIHALKKANMLIDL